MTLAWGIFYGLMLVILGWAFYRAAKRGKPMRVLIFMPFTGVMPGCLAYLILKMAVESPVPGAALWIVGVTFALFALLNLAALIWSFRTEGWDWKIM